jgi:hypothetical protein
VASLADSLDIAISCVSYVSGKDVVDTESTLDALGITTDQLKELKEIILWDQDMGVQSKNVQLRHDYLNQVDIKSRVFDIAQVIVRYGLAGDETFPES